MSKLELTIKTSYLPGWGVWEGIRELVQNGIDAETELGATLKVDHNNGVLRIENDGCVLPKEALLLGHTSKSSRSDLIGQFGEGLKLGILALVRSGRAVKIRSGSEVWVPTIARSEKFNADVLVFDIQGGREDRNRVRVEVGGVTQAEWLELREKFLFLKKKQDLVSVTDGDLLLGDDDCGKVFVKGIFVQNNPRLGYGYNFKHIAVDRDRKMVNSWDSEAATRRIWQEAVVQKPKLLNAFVDMLGANTGDVKGFDAYTAAYLPRELSEKVAEGFLKKHGTEAVPVANFSEAAEVEHLGKVGIVVSAPMQAVLTVAMGDLATIKRRLAEEVVCVYSPMDLTNEQRLNLEAVQSLLLRAGVVTGDYPLQVVDFRTPAMLGQYNPATKMSLVARKLLDDRHELLVTLVHELSHAAGGDGEKGHVAAMEKAWKAITVTLWS